MLPSVSIYHCANKHQKPTQVTLDKDRNFIISENDFIYIEVKSSNLLNNNCFIWLSDFKFPLTFIEHNEGEFLYTLNLALFFEAEDAIKFSHIFTEKNVSKIFYKVFLNYYGECNIEIEGIDDIVNFITLGKINIESDKISEIENLLDYLLKKEHYYWNTVSLTKVEATDKYKEEENLIWILKKLEYSIDIFNDKIVPNLSDSIGRLIPTYKTAQLQETSIITEESLLWLLENCNVLEPSNIYTEDSFLILNRPYKIEELLVQTLINETDVIENQVIHGYTNDVFSFLVNSFKVIEKLISTIGQQNDFKSKIYISYYQRLNESIDLLQRKVQSLKNSLDIIIPVSREHLNLSGSNRFLSKQHYHEAYIQISNWIIRNEAINSPQELFSGAKDISKLYEIFCLFKIIDTLTNDFNYKLVNSQSHDDQNIISDIYNVLDPKKNNLQSKYQFTKSSSSDTINLYYEMLPDDLTTVARGISKGYRPDFILEVQKEGQIQYIILDAKYKKIGTIQNYDYQELTMKYLHGIGMKTGGYFPILGLFIINPIDGSQISYYQKNEFSINSNAVSLPIIGRLEMGTNLNQYNYLKDLFSKLFNITNKTLNKID